MVPCVLIAALPYFLKGCVVLVVSHSGVVGSKYRIDVGVPFFSQCYAVSYVGFGCACNQSIRLQQVDGGVKLMCSQILLMCVRQGGHYFRGASYISPCALPQFHGRR